MIEHALCLAIAGVPSPRTLPPAMLRALADEVGGPTRPETPDARTLERAADAFAAGERAYRAGDWDTAVEHFEQAQRLAPHPFTEFNLGLAQAHAGRTLDAWRTFERLATEAEDPKDRAEAELQRAELREQVAMLRVDARPGAVACLDGGPIAIGQTAVVLPGPHRLQVDAQQRDLELEGGETRHVDLRSANPPSAAVRPLLGVAIGAGVLALGTGMGTLGTDDRGTEIGLAVTAGTAAAIAVGTTIAALVLHTRPPPGKRTATCARPLRR
jgi:hypothetical protein